jgi:non-specific serine/threonine protein kinase/serine/threonine-protein kinase
VDDAQKRTLEGLYQRALDLPPDDRPPFIRDHVPESLRADIEALIEHYEAARHSFLGVDNETPNLPDSIGPFQIVRLLGEGGMGNVYLAEQQQPIKRLVALKVIKPGMDSKPVLARFQAERQALAKMDHPAIAHVFEAGTTAEGRPFFAMEYVPGSPITAYADEARLTPHERIELFVQVCNGIQSAHQKGIIHRDIKPSNVIVSTQSGQPTPKVIDFGIAKAVEGDLLDGGGTKAGQLVGTPEYMSPEQAAGLDIDTRTDVYALGLLLYELLVGVLPFDPSELRDAGFEAMMRFIREFEPPRPSTRVSSLGETAVSTAHNRRTAPKSLTRFLRGDLDWVVIKSIEKERSRRYESVGALATDLRRYLHNEPVVARPPSATYRIGKFVRRNRAGVAIATSVFVALAAITIVSVWQSTRVALQRDLAQHEARVSREVADHFANVFHKVGITAGSMEEASLEVVLATGVTSLANPDLDITPGARVRLLRILADAYSSMAQLGTAQPLIELAVTIADSVYGGDHLETAECRFLLVPWYRQSNRFHESLQLAEQVLPVFERELGADHDQTLRCVWYVAGLYNQLDRIEEAMPHYRRLILAYEQTLGPTHPRLGMLRNEYGIALANEYRFDEAIEQCKQALAILEARYGEGNLFTLTVVEALCRLYPAANEPDSVLVIIAKAERIVRDNYTSDHSQMGDVFLHRGWARLVKGQYDLARNDLLDAQPLLETGSPRVYIASASLGLGIVERELGSYDQSRQYLLDTVELLGESLGESHPSVIETWGELAATEIEAGNVAYADSLLTSLRTTASSAIGADHPLITKMDVTRGLAQVSRGRYEEAERILLAAHESLHERSLRSWPSGITPRTSPARIARIDERFPVQRRLGAYLNSTIFFVSVKPGTVSL